MLLVAPFAREHVLRLLRRARVEATFRPAPSPGDVLRAADERLAAELAAVRLEGAAAGDAVTGDTAAVDAAVVDANVRGPREASGPAPDARHRELAARLLADMDATELVAALLVRAKHTGPLRPAAHHRRRAAPLRAAVARPAAGAALVRGAVARPAVGAALVRGAVARPVLCAALVRGTVARSPRRSSRQRGAAPAPPPCLSRSTGGSATAPTPAPARPRVPPRRRPSQQIGAIRIGSTASVVEVASPAAPEFARAVNQPDARDARIRIVRASSMRVE